MTTIVYNECITSISLLLKNVNDLYTREKEALLKLSKLEKENESLRELLVSKETGLHKETKCQQAQFPVVSQYLEESILVEPLADMVQSTQLTEQRDGKEVNGQIGCNRVKTMLQIPGMDGDAMPSNVRDTECEAKMQENIKESHKLQVEQACVKVEGETMDGDIGVEKQGLEIHDLSDDDNLVDSGWPREDCKRKREPSPAADKNKASDRAKDTKDVKFPKVVKQGNTRTPVMANARLAVIGMVFGGGICVREVDSTMEGASLEPIDTDFPEGKVPRHKSNSKLVADMAVTPTPTLQDAQRLRKSGEDNAVLKCGKITDTFKCKRSGGLHGEGKVIQTNSCGRAERRNRRLLSSTVRKRWQNRSAGKAVLEELSSDTEHERDTLERSGVQETSSKDSEPYIPDSDDECSGPKLATSPTIARRRFKKLKKFTVPSDQFESDSEFESVLSGIQKAYDV